MNITYEQAYALPAVVVLCLFIAQMKDLIMATKKRFFKSKVAVHQKVDDDNMVQFGKHSVKLTKLDKVLFPNDDITKQDLINYYVKVFDHMFPSIKNRAVTMHRFPNGITQEGFYQKDMGEYFPSWIKHVQIAKQGGHNDYVVCNNVATIAYLANQACITPHIWLSRITKLNYPDRMIFDLDPGNANSFSTVRKAAFALHKILDQLSLKSFVMTTGSRGLHVIVPLNQRSDFDTVRAFAYDIASLIANQNPELFTVEHRINKRKERVFIDTTRNAFAQTCVAPYAVRAQQGAPIATPITWEELENPRLTSQSYTMKNIFKRLQQHKDPWLGMLQIKQSISRARKKLDGLLLTMS